MLDNAFWGYYSREHTSWKNDAVFVFVESINWKTILRKYFGNIRINIVDTSISDFELFSMIAKKNLSLEMVHLFSLDGAKPSFFVEKYPHIKVVDISTTFHPNYVFEENLALYFEDARYFAKDKVSLNDFQENIEQLKSLFSEIIDSSMLNSFRKQQ